MGYSSPDSRLPDTSSSAPSLSGSTPTYASGPSLAPPITPYHPPTVAPTAFPTAPASVAPISAMDTPNWWMLQIPQVADVLKSWLAGPYSQDPGYFAAQLERTPWWQSTSDTARQWQQLAISDPATALQRRQQAVSKIQAMSGQIGMVLAPGAADSFADSAMRYGWTDQQIQDNLLASYHYSGAAGVGHAATIYRTYNDLAAQYGVPISDQTMGDWTKATLSGEQNQDSFTNYARSQAKSLYPALAPYIDQGVTVKQFFDPYAQMAAKELGVNPNQIDMMDPKWNKAINWLDPTSGGHAAMSLADWTTTIRTDPTYGYDRTQTARDAAAQLEGSLLKGFGQV